MTNPDVLCPPKSVVGIVRVGGPINTSCLINSDVVFHFPRWEDTAQLDTRGSVHRGPGPRVERGAIMRYDR